ncbi:MAG TPA: hypothetical protein VNF07_05245 [Acidimicrobiales bacterium]|nr:hypothetical protein [Acidimicrobiales bacterium]
MSEARIDFGTPAACRGADVGQLSRLLCSAARGHATHAVISPDDAGVAPRLVEFSHVSSANGKVDLDFPAAELAGFPEAVHYEVPPPLTTRQIIASNLAGGRYGLGFQIPPLAAREVVPPGEAPLDAYTRVQATDGPAGRLDGVIVEMTSGALVALVVHHGHLFSRRQVAVPIALVTDYGDGISLSVTRESLDDAAREL